MKEATHDTQPELEAGTHKALHRRKNRETRKMLEEHWTKQSLENNTLPALIASVSPADTDTLVDGLEKLHVGAVETVMPGNNNPELGPHIGLQDGTEDNSDFFDPSTVVAPSFPTFERTSKVETY